MSVGLYPKIEAYAHGLFEVGDGNRIYWETSGNPDGKPAVVVHGGPGSGSAPWQRRLFDHSAYRIVQFDQRGSGWSTPHASEPSIDLSANTTQNLVGDMEQLREHLDIDRWLVFGGSWGSTLSLAYAETHPDHVSGLILWGVTTGRRVETDWLFRGGVAPLFPEQWERLCAGVPRRDRGRDIVEAYSRLLHDRDPRVRSRAALEWCTWESATPDWPPTSELDERFTAPDFALGFARLVTHYVSHDLFLDDEILLRNAHLLDETPGILVNGRFDLQAPIGNAWALKEVWPHAELVIVDDAGHAVSDAGITRELIRATDQFAAD